MKQSAIKITNPSGHVIYYSEDDHRYFDDQGTNYKSTTILVDSLFPEFEKEKIAYFCARSRLFKEGDWQDKKDIPAHLCMKEKQNLLEEWNEKGKVASILGTMIHKKAECLLKKEEFPDSPETDKQKKMVQVVEDFIPTLLESYEFVEAEKIVFSPHLRVSGTVDLIMRNKQTQKLCIFDWKTNKAIHLTDSYNKKGKLFLSEFDDCNYWRYTLQLNIYKWVLQLERYGDFSDAELGILHVNTERVNPYQIPSLDSYQKDFLDYVQRLKG